MRLTTHRSVFWLFLQGTLSLRCGTGTANLANLDGTHMAELNPDALVYAEAQLRKFQKDPESVDPSWQAFLQGDDSLEGPSFPTRSLFDPAGGPVRAPIPGPTPPAVRSTKPAGDVLSQVPLFSGLTETELEAIAQRMAPITMAAGEVIFSSGIQAMPFI